MLNSPTTTRSSDSVRATELDGQYFDYLDRFIGSYESNRLLQSLWDDLEWSQYDIMLFGRRLAQPRLSAWYGDIDARYRYSGLRLEPMPWHPDLLRLKHRLQEQTGIPFNSVLANAYRDGNDSMGWHADNEKELGEQPMVASISLGATRRFLVRHRNRRRSQGIWLQPGSLLIMKRGCQEIYQHSVPRTRAACGLRINLTFRQIIG